MRSSLLFLSLLSGWTVFAQTTVTFKDGDFNSKDWDMVVVTANGEGGTPTVRQATFGGNPGGYRIIEITASGGTQARPAVVASFHRKAGAIIDLSQAGILTIDYAEDDKVETSASGGQGQASGPALQQADAAGNVHIYVLQNVYTGAPKAWTTKKLTGLVATDFLELKSGLARGVIETTSHPDFKKGAKPIQLGFYRATQDTGGGGCGGYGKTVTSEAIDNWSVTVTSGAAAGPSCSLDPRNSFLSLHLPAFHKLFPTRVQDHVLHVNVLSGDTAAANVDVTVTSTRGVFGANAATTATAKSDTKGVAQFTFSPPPPSGFDRTEFTAKGTVGTTAFQCTGSVTAGVGGLSEMLQRATDKSLPQGMALADRYRDELNLAGNFTLDDVREVPLSDRGRILLERALKRHDKLIQRALDGGKVKLSRRERNDVEALLRQFDSEDAPQIRHAAEVLRSHLKNGTVTVSESELQKIAAAAPKRGGVKVVNPSDRSQVARAYDNLPLTFEENQGQMGGPTRFLARGRGYRVYLTPKDAVFQDDSVSRWAVSPAAQVGLEVRGMSASANMMGEQVLERRSNYLIGDRPANWHVNVPHYAKVRYGGVYPGIDMVYYGDGRDLRFDFVVAPEARPSDIELAFRGAEHVQLDAAGNLLVDHIGGRLKFGRPFVYQEVDGKRQPVNGGYRLLGSNRVGFQVANYARNRTLVIDPVLSYSSLLGGDNDETAAGIAVDAEGNAYVVGVTASTTFPTVNPLQAWPASASAFASHVFVTKFNPAGTGLVYSTYIGGSGVDGAVGVAVDATGAAYVTGSTNSPDFPVAQPIQPTLKGGGFLGGDAFVLKLDPTGASLVYSTYLGGTDYDSPKGIAVDASGNAYVAGTTSSADFPVKNALQAAFKGGSLPFTSDGFVTKINAAGSELVYSTYLGGHGNDFAHAIAVDAAGNAYVTGSTDSSDFPLVNAIQTAVKGGQDVFVAKFNAAGSALSFSTLLGGESDDAGFGIAVDGSTNVYVAGVTGSSTFPLKNAIQAKLGAKSELGGDAFLLKLPASGTPLTYSTFLGGSGTDTATAVAVGQDGSAFVVGQTDSEDFPVLGSPFQPSLGGKNDGFLVKVNPAGAAIVFATYAGGAGQDTATGVALGADGSVYVAGSTTSADFPVTAGSFQTGSAGQTDALVMKIVDGTPVPRVTTVSQASQLALAAPEALVVSSGQGLADATEQLSGPPYATTLAGRSVTVKDSQSVERPAGLLAAGPKQVKFQIPAGTASGLAGVTISNGTTPVASGMIRIDAVAPGLYSADGTGGGVAQGTVVRVAGDGTQSYSSLARCDGATCAAIPVDLSDSSAQVFLNLIATGVRGRSGVSGVTASIGTVSVPVVAVDPQDPAGGVDVVNLGPLPVELRDAGSQKIVLVVDGRGANTVTATFGAMPASAPQINLSPAALDFTSVTVGQSKDLRFTVQNKGTAPLTVSRITSSSAAFAILTPMPVTIAAGAQGDVAVRFTPTAAGVANAQLTVVSDDPLTPQVAVALTGTGIPASTGTASITVSTRNLDFGSLLLGKSKDLDLSISGAGGTAPLTVTSIEISGAQFTLVNPPAFPATPGVAPLGLVVRYTPTVAGSDSGKLTIYSNSPTSPTVIAMVGACYPPGPVELKVDDGTFETGWGFTQGAPYGTFVNRLTPPGYPATLKSVRIEFYDGDGSMSQNTAVNILVGANPTGGTSIDTLRLSGSTGIVTAIGKFLEFPVKDLTIDSGDFVVGFAFTNPPNVFPVGADTNSAAKGRSYTSPDGTKYTQLPGANLGIRAYVVVGP